MLTQRQMEALALGSYPLVKALDINGFSYRRGRGKQAEYHKKPNYKAITWGNADIIRNDSSRSRNVISVRITIMDVTAKLVWKAALPR